LRQCNENIVNTAEAAIKADPKSKFAADAKKLLRKAKRIAESIPKAPKEQVPKRTLESQNTLFQLEKLLYANGKLEDYTGREADDARIARGLKRAERTQSKPIKNHGPEEPYHPAGLSALC
jgi:hypothetical protein